MKKSAHYFLMCFLILLSLYAAPAFAFVDPPTFAPVAPNSAQPIVVSVRSGNCHGLGFGIPGGRPLRIEYSESAIDIFSPGLINPSGACNFSIETTQFNVVARPPGNYQVRIWILDELVAPPDPDTVLVSEATLTVTQGVLFLTPVPSISIGGALTLITLLFFVTFYMKGAKSSMLFTVAYLASPAAFAQSNEKALLVLPSAAPGAPAPIDLVEPVNFSGGYLAVLSPGFVAENPTRAFYLLPRRAARSSVSIQRVPVRN